MNYSWTLLLSLLIACSIFGNKYEKNLTRDLDIYMQAYNDADYELMLNMLYPTYFDLFPHEQVLFELKEIRNQYGPMSMPRYNITAIMDPVAFTDTLYTIIEFDFDVYSELKIATPERKRFMAQQITLTYENKNIKFSEDSTTFTYSDSTTMVAISVNQGENWQFVDHKENPMGRVSSKCISPFAYVALMQKYKETDR